VSETTQAPTGEAAAAFNVGLVQMTSGREHGPNIEAASAMIRKAAAQGADFVLTPENTTMMEPDKRRLMEKAFAEEEHPAIPAFRELARELKIWLLIGSLCVRTEETRAANRSILFAPDGAVAARYDKIHMFDVDIPDGQTYRESATFRPGERAVTADLPWGRLGMTVCYDLRFPHLYRALAQAGASFLTVPAAFTKFTGEAHWHVLLRARAIETGCFVLAPAQCGTHAEERRTYGRSLAVAPWGEILTDGGEEPGVSVVRIDPNKVQEARNMVPSLSGDRPFTMPDGETRGVAAE
jgi:predicted amidohydrolase